MSLITTLFGDQRPFEIHSGQTNSEVIGIYKTSSVRYSLSWDSALTDLLHKVTVNPLKCSGIRWLHLESFSAIQVEPTFLISDIRALWRSELSARVSECQKLKM